MKKIILFPRTLLARAQRHFARSRPGSVLILVIALLVLMALIGTAFVTMAQFDRVAAQQHQFNTEVDLLLDGVINLVKGTVVSDLFQASQYRPGQTPYNQPTPPAVGTSYNYWNGVGIDPTTAAMTLLLNPTNLGDAWLANRIPDTQAPGTAASPTNLPLWFFTTGPLTGTHFDTPYWPNGLQPSYLGQTIPDPYHYTARYQMYPGSLNLPGVGAMPAWINPSPGKINNDLYKLLAADTSGSGIADAGLVKIPVGVIDGVTYYYAVRIVDNCAAVNASIAYRPNPYPVATSSGEIPGDFSPVNIDLLGLLAGPGAIGSSTYTAWQQDQLYSTPNYAATGQFPGLMRTRFNYVNLIGPQPIDDNDLAHSDFFFPRYVDPGTPGNFRDYTTNGLPPNMLFDMQWMQLGRRLGFPGRIASGQSFQALPVSESITMARNFILRDPNVASATASTSILERALELSTFDNAPSTPYAPSDTLTWFNKNFFYGSLIPVPIRALLVAQNPVSNFCPSPYRDLGETASLGPFAFGDSVLISRKGANGVPHIHRFVCINSGARINATSPTDPAVDVSNPSLPHYPIFVDPNWAFEPWSTAPTKTNANTATFQQLYAAYWAVMINPPQNQQSIAPVPGNPTPSAAGTWRMFRSPIRPRAMAATPAPGPNPPPATATPQLTPAQVVQLRAALAAINTIALRDTREDVPSRVVTLTDPFNGAAPVTAKVYGVKKQPYITEVYARNDPDPSKAWIAVELYNPYPAYINLTGWHLAALNRSTMTLTDIGAIPAGPSDTATDPVTKMPVTPAINGSTTATAMAGQYIVLASNATPPSSVMVDPGVPPFVVVPNLTMAFANELVLFRPRSATGTPLTMGTMRGALGSPLMTYNGPVPNNNYNEKTGITPNGTDLVPVDSYDLSNLAPVQMPAMEWHYIRPNDRTKGKDWHFVYPGRYNMPAAAGAVATTTPTVEPTFAQPAPPMTDLTGTLGKPDAMAADPSVQMNYLDVPIQLDNVNFGGLHKLNATGNSFPFGSFARNGDLLQVTFIGSYQLSVIGAGGQPTILEINPVTVDSAMATARDQSDGLMAFQPYVVKRALPAQDIVSENIGRFCPIDAADVVGLTPPPFNPPVDDFNINPATWRYHWATKLFDYLTVQGPQDDYFPEVDPNFTDPTDQSPSTQYKYLPAALAPPVNAAFFRPRPVANQIQGVANYGPLVSPETFNTNDATEETAPVQGLVNINTAPWRVLAAVPWVPATQNQYQLINAAIAQAIVQYRDVNDLSGANPAHGHGPFRSIFELQRVPVPAALTIAGHNTLRDVLGNNDVPPSKPGQSAQQQSTALMSYGDLLGAVTIPAAGTPLNNDFETKFQVLTRVSNLITTRSDSYTAYILVQGWRNAETANPELVVQRRAAIIIDRSSVTPINKSPNTVNVPEN